MKNEFISGERLAQFFLKRHTLHYGHLHFPVKEAKSFPPGTLGLVKRKVGVLEDIFNADLVLDIGIKKSDSDTCAAMAIVRAATIGVTEHTDDFLGDNSCVVGGFVPVLCEAVQEDDKFVATQAGDCVILAHAVPEPIGCLNQKLITDIVAQSVVNDFEVVEVDK